MKRKSLILLNVLLILCIVVAVIGIGNTNNGKYLGERFHPAQLGIRKLEIPSIMPNCRPDIVEPYHPSIKKVLADTNRNVIQSSNTLYIPLAFYTKSGLASLMELRGKYFGFAVAPEYLEYPEYKEIVDTHASIITPENQMKFGMIHPQVDVYNFAPAYRLVDYAIEQGIKIRGHTLVWYIDLPAWIQNGNYTRDEWIKILCVHIKTVVGHYRGYVYAWDVVNEFLHESGKLNESFWFQKIGPECIAYSLTWAHEADPDTLLFLNEFGAEGINAKSDALYALVQELLVAGIPLDGIGMQMHVYRNTMSPIDDVVRNMQRLGNLGLITQITEMDVSLRDTSERSLMTFQEQAVTYGKGLQCCLLSPSCNAFIVWGVDDKLSWLRYKSLPVDGPLLFEYYQPKLAFRTLWMILEP